MNKAISQVNLESSKFSMVIDVEFGGRITAFGFHGKNVLAESGPQVGSTFWPSPQSAWNWPPPAVLDSAPYTRLNESRGLRIESSVCPLTHLQLEKSFELTDEKALVSYGLTHLGDEPVYWAPWEITRIVGGVTFYQSALPIEVQSNAPVLYAEGAVWHDYQPQTQRQHEKIFGNGSCGWLANAFEGLLLVKRFPVIAAGEQAAPGEAEVEIYAHGDVDNAYIEMEQQGHYRQLMPGERLDWQVEWWLAELPPSVDIRAGNPALLTAVEQLLSA